MTGYLVILGVFMLCVAYVLRAYYDCQRRKYELDAELERMKLRNELENIRFQALVKEFKITLNNIVDTFLQTKRSPK